MKKLLFCVLTAALFAGCAKLHEDVSEERITRPKHEVEIPTDTPWDSNPQHDKPTGK